MLHAITWKQFGIAVGGAGLLYYLIVLFKYYRQEVHDLLAGRKSVPHNNAVIGASPSENLFGAALINEAEMNLVDPDELAFGESEPDEIGLPGSPAGSKSLLLGGVADFMQELKVLLRITKEAEDTKENFLMLLRLLISKHPEVATTTYAAPIAASVLEDAAELPFDLDQAALEQEFINPSFEE